jgi:hypothetical protein
LNGSPPPNKPESSSALAQPAPIETANPATSAVRPTRCSFRIMATMTDPGAKGKGGRLGPLDHWQTPCALRSRRAGRRCR